MTEEWRMVSRYDGDYAVSSLGRVRSIKQEKRRRMSEYFIMHTSRTEFGYVYCMLCKNSESKYESIHRLVAEAFVENPDGKGYVNHKDGNKENNSASNLEWVSSGENQEHAYKIGLRKRPLGTRNGRCRLTPAQVLEIRRSYAPERQNSLANEYGVTTTTIRNIHLRKLWKHL